MWYNLRKIETQGEVLIIKRNKKTVEIIIAVIAAVIVAVAGIGGGKKEKPPEVPKGSAVSIKESPIESGSLSYSEIPEYSGSPFTAVHGNVPFFKDSDLSEKSFEYYSPLDSLGRCGPASASVGKDLFPEGKRGKIGNIKPSGWHQKKYDFVDGKYLYNRCHLIGWQLSGENDNERNLITGTRTFNTAGMMPFENMVADYVKETGNHVMYRVTPYFEGDDLVAKGVLMEGESVEDKGEGILFCTFVYNREPGVTIDYSTGENRRA